MTNTDFFKYFRSPQIIRLAVMMYVRISFSLQNVQELLHERGIAISSRIASSATMASKSPFHRHCELIAGQRDQWFFLFVILDHLFHKLINLYDWYKGSCRKFFTCLKKDRSLTHLCCEGSKLLEKWNPVLV
jgi:hypothetical protein